MQWYAHIFPIADGESMVKFLLTLFLGWSGVYRFMRGQFALGLLYLFTMGLFYIGWFVDAVCALRDMVRAPHAGASTVQPQAPYAPPGDPFRSDTNADELLKYKQLLDSGAITQEEYDRKKRELLDPDAPSLKYVTCAYCGTQNLRGAAKCSACGAKLDRK